MINSIIKKVNMSLVRNESPFFFANKDGLLHLKLKMSTPVQKDPFSTSLLGKKQFRILNDIARVTKTAEEHIRVAVKCSENLLPKSSCLEVVQAAISAKNSLSDAEILWLRSHNMKILDSWLIAYPDPVCEDRPEVTKHWNSGLIDKLITITGFPDIKLPADLRDGFKILGSKENFGLFETCDKKREKFFNKPHTKPKVESVDHLKSICEAVLMSIESKDMSEELKRFVREESLNDVKEGRALGPYSIHDLPPFSSIWISPRFGIESSSGKRRLIDNLSFPDPYYRRSINSETMFFTKLHLPTISVITLLIDRLGYPIDKLRLGKVDHSGAYKQMGVHPDDYGLQGSGFVNQDGSLSVNFNLVMPFGAKSSVMHYQRISLMHVHLTCCIFLIALLSYIDDYFFIEKEELSESAMKGTLTINKCTGAIVKEEKTVWPASVVELLGLLVDFGKKGAFVRISFTKKSEILTELGEAIRTKVITEKTAGKLNFLLEALPGRVGRSEGRTIINAAQRLRFSPGSFLQDVELADIRSIMEVLRDQDFCRSLIPNKLDGQSPVIVYSDATGQGGGGIFIPEQVGFVNSKVSMFSMSLTPEKFLGTTKKVLIFEIVASIVAAYLVENHCLKHDSSRNIIIFTDNISGECIISKGSSRNNDLNDLIGTFWKSFGIQSGVRGYVSRVPTHLNPADKPSRGNLKTKFLQNSSRLSVRRIAPLWLHKFVKIKDCL
jgi:hypothetical protein